MAKSLLALAAAAAFVLAGACAAPTNLELEANKKLEEKLEANKKLEENKNEDLYPGETAEETDPEETAEDTYPEETAEQMRQRQIDTGERRQVLQHGYKPKAQGEASAHPHYLRNSRRPDESDESVETPSKAEDAAEETDPEETAGGGGDAPVIVGRGGDAPVIVGGGGNAPSPRAETETASRGDNIKSAQGGDLLSPRKGEIIKEDIKKEADKKEIKEASDKVKTERAAVRARLERELEELQVYLDDMYRHLEGKMAEESSVIYASGTSPGGSSKFAKRFGKAIVAVQQSGEEVLMEPFVKHVGTTWVRAVTQAALKYHELLVKYNDEPDRHYGTEDAEDRKAEDRKAKREKGDILEKAFLNRTPRSISKEDLEAYHQNWVHLEQARAEAEKTWTEQFRKAREEKGARKMGEGHSEVTAHSEGWSFASHSGPLKREVQFLADRKFYDLWQKLQHAEREVDKKLDSLVGEVPAPRITMLQDGRLLVILDP